MTPRERFARVFRFEPLEDRLPMVEWAPWWDLTFDRWKREGLPRDLSLRQSMNTFGLDPLVCIGATGTSSLCPSPTAHGAGILTPERSYDDLLPCLYADSTIDALLDSAKSLKEEHDRGDIIIRLWLDGFFWFSRTLFGIENHFYAFHDHPDLMRRIHQDLASFNLRVVESIFNVLLPDMVGFAEDMSYNHGPMLSHSMFTEFMTPYYRMVIPAISERGVKVLVDSDGDVTTMVPWLLEAGIEGVYPLERQAGVDVAAIRRSHPSFLMMGGYDKMVMTKGEAAMRGEFERLLPVMRSGGFIPSVDHQTPPGVSLDEYRVYLRLFEEYARKATR